MNNPTDPMLDGLKHATGHHSWVADGEGNYVTQILTDDTSNALIRDIEQLKGRVAPRALPEGTVLVMNQTDAAAFIALEEQQHDPLKDATAPDTRLKYLKENHNGFVWQKVAGGYTGAGYEVHQHEALTQPFDDAGVDFTARDDIHTSHDETHGIFISDKQVDKLIQYDRETPPPFEPTAAELRKMKDQLRSITGEPWAREGNTIRCSKPLNNERALRQAVKDLNCFGIYPDEVYPDEVRGKRGIVLTLNLREAHEALANVNDQELESWSQGIR